MCIMTIAVGAHPDSSAFPASCLAAAPCSLLRWALLERSSGVRICHQPPVGGVVFEVSNTSSADADYTGSDHLLVQWDQVGILQDSNRLPRTFLQLG